MAFVSIIRPRMVTLDDIRTPPRGCSRSRGSRRCSTCPASPAGRCWLKCESLQPGGAFKIRGAYNMVAQLTADQRAARRHHLLVRQPRPGDGARGARARRARGRRHADHRAADQGRRRARLRRRGHLRRHDLDRPTGARRGGSRRARPDDGAAVRSRVDHRRPGHARARDPRAASGRRDGARAGRRRRAARRRRGGDQAVAARGPGHRRRAGRRGGDEGVDRRRSRGHAATDREHRRRPDAGAPRRPDLRPRAASSWTT